MAKKNLAAAAAAATEGMFTSIPGQMEFTDTDMKVKETAREPVKQPEKPAMNPEQGCQKSDKAVIDTKKELATIAKEAVKRSSVTFSYRTSADNVAALKAYADASGSPTGALVDAAIAEYIKRHPLKGTAAEIYELKLKG